MSQARGQVFDGLLFILVLRLLKKTYGCLIHTFDDQAL